MKILKLYWDYYWYLGISRFLNRLSMPYYWWKGCKFDQLDKIHANFELADELCYVALLARYLNNLLKYSDIEKFDIPRNPEVTLWLEKANCNDGAMIFCQLLADHKSWCAPRLMIVQKAGWRGHCVCCFQHNNAWYHVTNWGLSTQGFQTLEALALNIHPEYDFYVLTDEHLNLKGIKLHQA